MLSRSTWLHLRIPFSYFLLPVYLFALGFSNDVTPQNLVFSFLIIHLFLYPASNGYNSYFDKDEQSIGGLRNPPPVKKELYYSSLVFDGIAIVLSFLLINITFGVMIGVYGLVSKMYSHPSVRLKRYAVAGWTITGLFQGIFTFVMCYLGINKLPVGAAFKPELVTAGLLTSVMLWANYPMTQVYQHEEDTKRGDKTLSVMLGIRGTFVFVQVVFGIAAIGFFFFFMKYFDLRMAIAFLLAMSPVVGFFLIWFFQVWRNEEKADFENTMRLNLISATCLNAFFIYFALRNNL